MAIYNNQFDWLTIFPIRIDIFAQAFQIVQQLATADNKTRWRLWGHK